MLNVTLNKGQFAVISDNISELQDTHTPDTFKSVIEKLSEANRVTWREDLVHDLYDLLQSLVYAKDEITIDDLMLYIDVLPSEADFQLIRDSDNQLEAIIPTTLSTLRAEFHRFVSESESSLSKETSESARLWFRGLLRFGDRLVAYVG